MKIVSTAKQLGMLIQKVRKEHRMTQKELAGACGTGVRFIQELEKGKRTAELGKSLYVAKMLGITLDAKLPPASLLDE